MAAWAGAAGGRGGVAAAGGGSEAGGDPLPLKTKVKHAVTTYLSLPATFHPFPCEHVPCMQRRGDLLSSDTDSRQHCTMHCHAALLA